MDSEAKSPVSNRKLGQCKSLQSLASKTLSEKTTDKIKLKQRVQEIQPMLKSKSHKTLNRSKFDTPEKRPSPKVSRELKKSPISPSSFIIELSPPVPFPSNLSLVPKNQICNLIKNGQPKPSNLINPILLTPILVNRKQIKENENEKASLVARSNSPNEVKETPESKHNPFQINLLKFSPEKQISEKSKTQKSPLPKKTHAKKVSEESKIPKSSEPLFPSKIPVAFSPKLPSKASKALASREIHVSPLKLLSPETTPEASKQFYYNKLSQPSFGGNISLQAPEEEGPAFISERHSYDCESNQSLKFDLDRHCAAPYTQDSLSLSESHHNSFAHEAEKTDIETQTEEPPLPDLLKCLDDFEIKLGIKFISQIAEFVKSFK